MTRRTFAAVSNVRVGIATLIAGGVVVAGGAKEVLIARTFGVDQDLDLYLIASAMPLAIVTLFGNAWQSAATPALASGGLGTPGRPYLRLVKLVAIPITFVSLATALAATTEVVPDRFGVGTMFPTHLAMLTLSAALGLVSAGWYPLALLAGRPNLVIAAPAAVHLGMAVTVSILGRSPWALYGGLLAGYIGLFVALRSYGLPRGLTRRVTVDREAVGRIFLNFWPIAAGGAAMALALPIDLLFAARVTAGGPSIINYATRVPLAVSVIGASVISTTVFAGFVALRTDPTAMRADIRRWIMRAAGYSVLAAGLLWVSSHLIVDILFGSERLAGPDLQSVVDVHRVAVLSIPPFLSSMVLVRAFNALAVNRPLLWISMANVAINIAGNWLLAPILGLPGIMLSTAVMYSCSGLFLWLAWRRVARRTWIAP